MNKVTFIAMLSSRLKITVQLPRDSVSRKSLECCITGNERQETLRDVKTPTQDILTLDEAWNLEPEIMKSILLRLT